MRVFPPDVSGLFDFLLKRRGGGVKDGEGIFFWAQNFACFWLTIVHALNDVRVPIEFLFKNVHEHV